MEKLKVLSLFAGVGGFDHGLEATGAFETVAFVELDKDCQTVLKKQFPNVPIFSDVTNVSTIHVFAGEDYLYEVDENGNTIKELFIGDGAKIDVICGGFPCQDISVAGKQKGFVDEKGQKTRSGLWTEYKRLVQEIGPKYVIIENVAQLLNNGMPQVLVDLDQAGYDCEWRVISAREAGAPHLRKRVWIIARKVRGEQKCQEIPQLKLPKFGKMINGVITTLDETDWNFPSQGPENELLPTPTAHDWKSNGSPSEFNRRSPPLSVAIQQYPTPTTMDAGKPLPPRKKNNSGGQKPPLVSVIGTRLNAQFPEWLMGFPVDWTQTQEEVELKNELNKLLNDLNNLEKLG